MKILIIDDDKNILSFLDKNLKKYDFSVNTSESGANGLNMILKNKNDLIIIDLNLPDIDGFELCKLVRKNKIMLPILILSGDDKINSKIKLLNSGADDYLIKPFQIEELVARMNALLRRPHQISENTININGLEINKKNQKVKKDGQEIYLTRKEYLILELLISSPGKIFSRSEIIEKVWDNEIDIFSKVIETHILNLRNKVDKPFNTNLISTATGRGYRIKKIFIK